MGVLDCHISIRKTSNSKSIIGISSPLSRRNRGPLVLPTAFTNRAKVHHRPACVRSISSTSDSRMFLLPPSGCRLTGQRGLVALLWLLRQGFYLPSSTPLRKHICFSISTPIASLASVLGASVTMKRYTSTACKQPSKPDTFT